MPAREIRRLRTGILCVRGRICPAKPDRVANARQSGADFHGSQKTGQFSFWEGRPIDRYRAQNPVLETECGFDSRPRHHYENNYLMHIESARLKAFKNPV